MPSNEIDILALNKRCWEHPRAGGAEYNLEKTLTGLGERGHNIHLLTTGFDGKTGVEYQNGVKIEHVRDMTFLPPPWDIVAAYMYLMAIFHIRIFRDSYDCVYTINSPLPWLVYSPIPRVTIFHHIAIDSIFETHDFPQNLLGYLAQWLAVINERKTPTVSVSPSTTEELVQRGHRPDSIYEIRNGIDIEVYQPGRKSNSPSVLFLGGIETYKGADRLPEIHQNLRRQVPDAHLHIAGRNGEVTDQVKEYCTNQSTASFYGFVSFEKKIELLQSAWVLIAPSRVEGWGISVLEANACKTPAIGTNVSGLSDSIRHQETGLLVDEYNPVQFATAIAHLLENEDIRDDMGIQARNWAEQHTWEDTVDQFEDLFITVSSK